MTVPSAHCEVKLHGFRRTQDGVVVSFVVHPAEVPKMLALDDLGTRYMLALAAIEDNEEPREPPGAQEGSRPPEQQAANSPAIPPASGGAIQGLVRPDAERRRYAAFLRSVNYPKNPDFQKWVFSKIGRDPVGNHEAQAAGYIKWRCGIDTRLDIKTDEAVCEKFLDMEAEFNAETPGRLAERRG